MSHLFIGLVCLLLGLVVGFLCFGCLVQTFKPNDHTTVGYIWILLSTILLFFSAIQFFCLPNSLSFKKREYIFIHPLLRKYVLSLGFPPFIIRLVVLILMVISVILFIGAILAVRIAWFSEIKDCSSLNEDYALFSLSLILGFPFMILCILIFSTKIIKWVIKG